MLSEKTKRELGSIIEEKLSKILTEKQGLYWINNQGYLDGALEDLSVVVVNESELSYGMKK